MKINAKTTAKNFGSMFPLLGVSPVIRDLSLPSLACQSLAQPCEANVRASIPQMIPHSRIAVMTASQVSQNNGLRRIGAAATHVQSCQSDEPCQSLFR